MLEFNLTGHRLSLLHSTFFFVLVVIVVVSVLDRTINAFSSHSLDALVCTERRKKMHRMQFRLCRSHATATMQRAFTLLRMALVRNREKRKKKTNENLVLLCGLIHNNKMYNIESNDCDTYSRLSPGFRSAIIFRCAALDSMFCLVFLVLLWP